MGPAPPVTAGERDRLARRLIASISDLADQGDELLVIDGFVRGLVQGRLTYGALDLRRPRDWQREGDEEIRDFAIYSSCGRIAGQLEIEDAITVERPTVQTRAFDLSDAEGERG